MGSTMAIVIPRVTKLLYKSAMPIGETGLWTSDPFSHESKK